MNDPSRVDTPPEFTRSWVRSERPVPRLLVRPLERFLHREDGSAALLMGAAAAALLWANLWPSSYDALWTTVITIDLSVLVLEEDLRHVVNDLLMAVFFYVVALEVKRELLFGSLRNKRSAAVPVAAAFGTMVGAALTYVAVNLIGDGDLRGWAIPIATDIAFAIGVLGLLGDRVPRELRAFLLTLAVVDDLATIVVIAVFFTADLSVEWLLAAVVIAAAVSGAQRVGVRLLVAYVVLAGALWLAVFESGVHATIAGVVLGFLTPAWALHARTPTAEVVGGQLKEIARSDVEVSYAALMDAARMSREAVPPLIRMEETLHPWSAYAILPLFALANAGVPVSLGDLGDALGGPIGLGIFLGLVVGAPIGGFFFAWAITKVGPGQVPEGLDWKAIGGVTPLKGIGFTIAIFITGLTFSDRELQETATLAVLLASFLAALIGLAVLYARHRLARGTARR